MTSLGEKVVASMKPRGASCTGPFNGRHTCKTELKVCCVCPLIIGDCTHNTSAMLEGCYPNMCAVLGRNTQLSHSAEKFVALVSSPEAFAMSR